MSRRKEASFMEKWEVQNTAIVVAVSMVFSWIWARQNEAILDVTFSFPRYTYIAVGLLAIFILTTSRIKTKQKSNYLRFIGHVSSLTFLLLLFWDWWYWEYLLSATWFTDTTFFTGRVAITLLFLSLSVTPLITLFGWSALQPLKKIYGNYGFILVCAHLLMFTIDYAGADEGGLQLGLALEEAITKQYALIGFIAFLLLIPLFVTSNKYSQKRLKRNWVKLHKLVYLINILAVAHFIWVWLSKLALAAPLSYAIILIFLLILRIEPIKKRVVAWRKQRQRAQRQRKAAAS